MKLPVFLSLLLAGCSGPGNAPDLSFDDLTADEVAGSSLLLHAEGGAQVLVSPGFCLDSTALGALKAHRAQPDLLLVVLFQHGRRSVMVPDPGGWRRYPEQEAMRRTWISRDRIEVAEGETGPLELHAVERGEDSEVIAVRLPLEALEASRSTGFVIRFHGSQGERAVKVPPPVIDGFLRRLAEFNG